MTEGEYSCKEYLIRLRRKPGGGGFCEFRPLGGKLSKSDLCHQKAIQVAVAALQHAEAGGLSGEFRQACWRVTLLKRRRARVIDVRDYPPRQVP